MKYLTLIIFIAFVASCSKDNDDDIIPPPEENTPATLPQKELRGVWVTTAWGIDWPMEEYNATAQKQKYIDYLDLLVENKMNAIFFQIRGMADAFYDSQYVERDKKWLKNNCDLFADISTMMKELKKNE